MPSVADSTPGIEPSCCGTGMSTVRSDGLRKNWSSSFSSFTAAISLAWGLLFSLAPFGEAIRLDGDAVAAFLHQHLNSRLSAAEWASCAVPPWRAARCVELSRTR